MSRQVELKEVFNTDVAVFTTALVLSELGMTAQIFIPRSVGHLNAISKDSLRASIGVWDLYLDCSDVGAKDEPHRVSWSASELHSVVSKSLNLDGEARETLLSSVESVPHVVHHRVDLVLVTSHFVGDVHWLDRAVLVVRIKRLKEKHSQVSVGAVGGAPLALSLAVGVARDCIFDVRDDLEVLVGLDRQE